MSQSSFDSKNRVWFANSGVARTLQSHLNWGMKAQYSKQNGTQIRLANTGDKGPSDWQLLSGLSLADIGLLVVGFAGWDALTAGTQTLLYSVGGMLCLVGLVLIWIGTSNLAHAAQGPAKWSKSNCLGYARLMEIDHMG